MYVDFEKLLPKEDLSFEDKSVHLQSSGKSEYRLVKPKTKQSIKFIDQWTSAFLKFLAIYSEKFPNLIPSVIKHAEIVRELATRRTGMSWLIYDKKVRKDIAAGVITWGKLHYEYWVLATTMKQTGPSNNFRSHTKYTNKGESYIAKRIPRGFCFAFNRSGKCTNHNCSFKHTCYLCGKPHSVFKCSKGEQASREYGNSQQAIHGGQLKTSK
jgi:hypothetical protein